MMNPQPELGRLEPVDPRSVWPNEAHDFTPWLLANGDRLAEALGIELELTAREHAVGGYSLDIIGRDLTHDAVLIVENQLADSDHGHLGQLLTYAAGTSAATIVWIAPRFRDEHRQAIQWLNEQTGQDTHFFAVEIGIVRIGQSTPAPLFNVVAQPNDWQKTVRAGTTGQPTGKGSLYREFWTKYLDSLRTQHPGWSQARGAPSQSWFPMSAGLRGCIINASFAANGRLRHELYIDRPTQEECKTLFDHLFAQRDTFEQAYGRELEWERLDHRKASRISDYTDGDVSIASEHHRYLVFLDDAGQRLRSALAAVDLST